MKVSRAKLTTSARTHASFASLAFVLAFSLSLLGCQRTFTDTAVPKLDVNSKLSSEKIYPHPADWTDAGTHGAYFARGAGSCTSCHGADLAGGTSKISCTSCHAAFPHTADFKSPEKHGTEFLKDSNNCKTCHGADLRGGTVKKSCTECHANFPHTAQFALPSNHGAAFIASLKGQAGAPEKTSCFKCHSDGVELSNPVAEEKGGTASGAVGPHAKTGNNIVSCKSCHTTFPHPEATKWKTEHGLSFLQNRESCTTCHGADLKGGSVGISCAKCHESYPHVSGWSKPAKHGLSYTKGLNDQRAAGTKKPVDQQCFFCHSKKTEKPPRGSAQLVSCDNCHVGMPHNSKMLNEDGELKHHMDLFKELSKPERVSFLQTCFKCHSVLPGKAPQRKNLPGEKSCTSCHGEPAVQGEQKTTYDENGNPVYNGEVDVILKPEE